MEKIAQENAVLSKDLESLIREVAAMTAKQLHIFRRLQPLIFTPILPVKPSTKASTIMRFSTVVVSRVHLQCAFVFNCRKNERKKKIQKNLSLGLKLFTYVIILTNFL